MTSFIQGNQLINWCRFFQLLTFHIVSCDIDVSSSPLLLFCYTITKKRHKKQSCKSESFRLERKNINLVGKKNMKWKHKCIRCTWIYATQLSRFHVHFYQQKKEKNSFFLFQFQCDCWKHRILHFNIFV
jgi:hypothetical protein